MGTAYRSLIALPSLLITADIPMAVYAEEDEAALAKKISDPVAHIINVPFQFSYDDHIGPSEDGDKWTMKFQPVVPFTLNENWSVISRTILPVVYQADAIAGSDQFGLSDITQSFFFKPNNLSPHTTIALGPVFTLPIATNDVLGSEKWGAGPTGIIVQHAGPWTLGFLTNHVWSFAGDHNRDYVSDTLLQPFISYNTPNAWTYNIQSESTYDWNDDEASVPVNFTISKMVKFGQQPVSFSGGVGYWVEHPDEGPEDWHFKFGVTFVFPK